MSSRTLTLSCYRNVIIRRERIACGHSNFSTGQQSKQSSASAGGLLRWFGIPITLGVACISLLQLRRVLWKERDNPASPQPMTWQLVAFLQIPTRSLSRLWGTIMEKEIHPNLRVPLLGLYKVAFSCNMDEAEESELKKYKSFKDLFIRKLKEGVRPIDPDHHLVSPIDGKVLHFGTIKNDHIEQVKRVHYSMHSFLGPGLIDDRATDNDDSDSKLYHVVLYLAPGDCHHFYSPTDWSPTHSRHLPGELITVAPWAAKTMPGLFALNERVILNGLWKHGLFVFAAVGAYNVGSISIDIDQDIKTNKKGKYLYGSHFDKDLRSQNGEDQVGLVKGEHVGVFQMGSSVVLVFEAPKNFEFVINRNQTIKIGQPIGK